MYNIVLNSDENYIKYASVLITNIIYKIDKTNALYENAPINFHILSKDLSDECKGKLRDLSKNLSEVYPCEICLYSVDESVFENLPTLNGNYAAYARILSASTLPQSIKTCLYLDVDMFVLCDIREIFTLEFKTPLAAIPDFGRYANRILKAKNPKFKDIVLNKNYFNSGFLLLDLQALREQNVESKFIEILQNYHLRFHDQDILNAVFINNYTKLSFAYNFITPAFSASVCKDEHRHFNIHHTRSEFNKIQNSPKILHFTSAKPWILLTSYIYKGQFISTLWWEVAEKVEAFNKELQAQKQGLKEDFLPFCVGFEVLNASIFKLPFCVKTANNRGGGHFAESYLKYSVFSRAISIKIKRQKLFRAVS